jgi:hypothetical protein
MTQLRHSSESQTSAEPWHLHKIENPSPLYILFIFINETHQSDNNLAGDHVSEEEPSKIQYVRTENLHNENRKGDPAKEQSCQLSSDLRRFQNKLCQKVQVLLSP